MKKLIIKLIGYNNYRSLLVFVFRLFNNIHKKSWLSNQIDDYYSIGDKDRNIYFGYYDHPSVEKDDMLYISTTNDVKLDVDIYIYNIKNKRSKKIGVTNAWNFQMGTRLRWLESEKIIYNFFDDKIGFCSKIINKDGVEINRYNFPIYDISKDFQYSFYCDFSVLNAMRPGYGYNNILVKKSEIIECENGIFKGEFKTGKIKKILSIENIIKYNPNNCCEGKFHYINHVSCSNFSDNIMFFHLWEDKYGNSKNRVFIIDYSGKIINVLDDFDGASHYSWKNSEEILLTVIVNNKCEYRLYNILNKEYRKIEFLKVDGHPSYINDELFITDTYPDHNGMEHIFLCNENNIIKEICTKYHNPRKNGEFRCDLHPRYYNGYLTFDSLSGSFRQQEIVKIDLINSSKVENKEWFINKYKKRLYLFLNNAIDINPLKYMYYITFNFSYKAHLLIYKMLNCKSKIIREMYYNKLQKVYSMWISPDCKIGENVHFMHLDGVTIGSGVVIGDNCTIYQQVTIGKERGGFPIIGNNVKIYAGAKIIGGIEIGENSVIGANAVVISDVPPYSVAVGVPAKIIKRRQK